MLIALFTLLFAVMASGGQDSPFVIPKVEKYIKQVIEDKDRRQEMLVKTKEAKKEFKALKKVEKKQAKELASMIKDRNADPAQIAEALKQAREQRYVFQQKMIDGRVASQEIITQEEWETIMGMAQESSPKKVKKKSKEEVKASMQQNKKIQALSDEIVNAFQSESKQEEAKEYLSQFEDDLSELLVASQEYPERSLEVMKDYQATREELASVIEELETIRQSVNQSYLALWKELRDLSTEEEWPKLAKALLKLV